MKSCKKIVSCFLCIAILTSFLCVPASANDGIAGAAQDFFEWSVNWSQGVQNSFWKAIYGDSWMEDENGGWTGADRDELTARYNEYISSLQTDLGTATLINGGIRLYFPSVAYSTSRDNKIDTINLGVNSSVLMSVANFMGSGAYISRRVYFAYEPIPAPFACSYTSGWSYTEGSNVQFGFGSYYLDKQVVKGELIKPGTETYYFGDVERPCYYIGANNNNSVLNASCCVWVDIYPLAGATVPTTQNITVNSRPASIVGDYGIIGDDGTIIKVDGNMIVDESTSTVFNPVTNVTNNYIDYAFDYSDRSYNLTLEDGSTLKVVYGEENVTIHEGDTIYNIYYLIPDDSGSGGGSDSGDTPSGEDMSWWKQAWTSFTDKLFSILGNGGSSVNPDIAPVVPDDEETGEKGYSIIDLFVVLKDGTWAFITGIVSTAYDGFTGFVESVSSAGSFFTFYDEESEDGILFVPLEGGETIWD